MRFSLLAPFLLAAGAASAAIPGFRIELVAPTSGFATQLAVSSTGAIYYSTTSGDIVRFDSGANTVVAHVPTVSGGNSGLIGLEVTDDSTAFVHYTTENQTYDVISRINLATGEETVLHAFAADINFPERGSSTEHHGGNLAIAKDGTIYFGIGEYGVFFPAPLPEWNGGKIWKIAPDGTATQIASGFRNPFGIAWDEARQWVIVTDNGDAADDEIDVITQPGQFYGYPYTEGNRPPYTGAIPPVYTFPAIVAPTGVTHLSGANPMLHSGYLISAFVTKALYYVPDIAARPLPDPISLVTAPGPLIDVAETPSGDILVTTGSAIYRVITPARGDCNADGFVNAADIGALESQLSSIGVESTYDAPSWGCDLNGDGTVDSTDLQLLIEQLRLRVRAVRRR